jgi:hypothetical protein
VQPAAQTIAFTFASNPPTSAVRAGNATIAGPADITASIGLVLLGDDETPPWVPSGTSCAGSQIAAPLAPASLTGRGRLNAPPSALLADQALPCLLEGL